MCSRSCPILLIILHGNEITQGLWAKIFGLNATRPYNISAEEVMLRAGADRIANHRLAYRQNPDPHFQTFGPKTRREFLDFLKISGGI